MNSLKSHRVKEYLIYAWHIVLVLAIIVVVLRAQIPSSKEITLASYNTGDITRGTFHGVKISLPSELFDTFSALELKGETRDGRMKLRLVREDLDQPFMIMINDQSYGKVTTGDRLEIDYGPKVKVNGEKRRPVRVTEEASDNL